MELEYLKKFLAELNGSSITDIAFVRGYGIIPHYFTLVFENGSTKYEFEIETNFRVRDKEKILLVFNDLYLDQKGKELSVRRYRSQQNIEKTLLFNELALVNERVKDSAVSNVNAFCYGDIIISLDSDIWIEITNDLHEDDSTLYRITKTVGGNGEKHEVIVQKDELILL